MARVIVVVARDRPDLFSYFDTVFAGMPEIKVLIEKAFTVNASEARQIVDLAKAKNLVVLEAMWSRFLPHMIRIREIVAPIIEASVGIPRVRCREMHCATTDDQAQQDAPV